MRLAPFVILTCLVAAPAVAQSGPGSTARESRLSRSLITVDANLRVRDGCQAVLSHGRGAPPGAAVPARNVPVTVVVGRDPRGCSGRNVVRARFNVSGGLTPDLVEIFFVGRDGRVLKHEKVAIRTAF